MRILHYFEKFWPSIGGVQVSGAHLIGGLHARGHENAIAVANRQGLATGDEFRGIPVRRYDVHAALAKFDLISLLAAERELTAFVDMFAPDVIHLHHSHSPTAMAALRLSRRRRLPLVVTLAGELRGAVDARQQSVLADVLQRSSWVAACSSAILEQALAVATRLHDRASVIHYCFDLRAGEAPPLLRLEPPRLLCLARLSVEKGVDDAIRATALLVDRFTDLELHIGGDGSERQSLENLTRELGLERQIRFLGWVPPARVPAALETASLLVIPSHTEGFPRVVLEAAGAGLPAVATRVGGLSEAILDGETGVLVDPGNPEALARGIASLLEDPSRASQMGRRAWMRATREFSCDRAAEAYETVYERVVT